MRHDKETASKAILQASQKVYEKCLIFYPSDLRNDFGCEMMEVFDEQASEAYSRTGFAGLLRVWFKVIQEFVTFALPERFGGHMVPIVAVTVVLAFMLWFASYIGYVMETACPHCGH